MDMYEDVWYVKNLLNVGGDGFIIRENISPEDIKTSGGEAKDDETTRTCAICVALNKTVYKSDNKPQYYHPNCKCEEKPYDLKKVNFDFPMEKITNYLFVHPSKEGLIKIMGYMIEDADYIYKIIRDNAERKFLAGEYELGSLDNHGQAISIILEMKGAREKIDHLYRIKTGWTAYPYGTLHNNTPFAGWAK